MKKIYSNPSMKVIRIQVSQFLAVSGIDTQNNQAGLSTKSAVEGVDAGGRGGWFDEDEE